MDGFGLLWFFVRRMVLSGCKLGAVLGAAYSAVATPTAFMIPEIPRLVSELKYPGSEVPGGFLQVFLMLVIFGVIFGIVPGALLGLVLGTVAGFVLFFLTKTFFRPLPTNIRFYREVAGWVCALGTELVLFADWTLNDFPNVATFAPYRMLSGYFFTGYGRKVGSGDVWSGDNFFAISNSLDTLIAVIYLVVGPVIVAFLAMYFSGMKVAGQYAREFGAADSANATPTTGSERPEES